MRAAMSPLHEMLGPDEQKLGSLLWSIRSADQPLFQRFCSGPTLRQLARNCLHTMKKLFTYQLPWSNFRRSTYAWSYLLRSCPPCPDLLAELELVSELVSSSTQIFFYGVEDLHNIVQWLKKFPQPPSQLMGHYESHLHTKIRETGDHDSEWHWKTWEGNLTRCNCFDFQVMY
ncbi:hypothetical protein B0H13DRAFT_1974579 [Mycena leptocephala]|nr:hypothetical protein B0H13DRAFT_1974579 [Mycena leptocephala]